VSTDETEIFSALIGEVYDAALDPGVWPSALAKIAADVGGDAVVLAIREISNRTAGPTYFFNSSEAVTDAYNQTYIKLDPTYIGFNLAQIGDAISTDDVLSYAEFVETRFYKEFAVPQGWVDSVGLLVDRTQTSATVMCVIRGSQLGLADADAKRRARLVGPHLRRAVVIGRQLAHHKARADNLASALDGIGAAFFLVDGVGRLQHVNAAGVEALERGEPLHAVAGRLVARDADANRTLALVFAASMHGDMELGVKGIAIPLEGSDGDRFAAHVLPLTSGARRKRGFGQAAAALFVSRATFDAPSALQNIAKAFGLTPMELRVLLAIVEVGGVPEVATALGVAETTVKSHLRGVFAKTGAGRQADLVKLVASYASPLIG
jgi:DNA-binding CsgD family transcriptional regulator